MVFLVLVMVVGAFAGDYGVRCPVGITRGRVTVGGGGGIRVILRLVTIVFLVVDNLGTFVLFVLVLFCFSFVAMLSIVSVFLEVGTTMVRVERLLMFVGIFTAEVVVAMPVCVTKIMGMYVLVGVSMLNRRSCVRMDDVRPRFAHVTLKRVWPRFMAVGTVLARLLIIFCPRKINHSAHGRADIAKANEGTLRTDIRA